MASQAFLRWTGAALCVAAILLVIINVVFTPQLPEGAFSSLAQSQVYFWRQCLAALTAFLMTFGIVGVFSAQADRVSFFGRAAFLIALAGGMALFATEWAQIFIIRDFALHNPAAIDQLEDLPGLTLFDLGALAAFGVFALGWVLLAVSALFARVFTRWSAGLVLIAFFVTPALGAFGVWGAAGGSVLIAIGWIALGVQIFRIKPT
jgi:hypothetical protein